MCALALHEAIRDALRDGRSAYEARDVLVGLFLEATRPLHAHETLLYQSAYTIFRALPPRLLRGSTLNVATHDTPEGVELAWEWREPLTDEAAGDARVALSRGPHGDLLEIALLALERCCDTRAGFMEATRSRVDASSSFDRPPYLVRRIVARIPARRDLALGSAEPGHASADAE